MEPKSFRKVEIGTSKYTQIFSEPSKEFNCYHEYSIESVDPLNIEGHYTFADIKFQKGPIKENGVNGCHNEDLIAIVIDRLQCFQESSYKCRENAIAITKLEEALMWLRKRTDDRIKRNVEGTSQL